MNRVFSVMGLVLMASVLLGCSNYRQAVLPNSTAEVDKEQRKPTVRVGQIVRMSLVSGEIVEGEVTRVDDQSVILGNSGNYGFTEEEYLVVQIQSVEVHRSSDAVAKMGGGMTVVLFGAAALLIAVGLSGGLSPGP